jgi:hypothetical protein
VTTDIERELRELFRDKAGEAPVSTLGTSGVAPPQVLRRGRRHQVGTVLGSTLVALLLAAGSFAGLRSLLRSDTDPFRTGREYDVFERTATIEAFTVTSPSDWFLVNEWPLSMQMAVGSGSASEECTVGVEPPVCTGDEEAYLEPLPSGLPMFQLSNTDMGLSSVACGADLAADTAVLSVAMDYARAIEGIADPSIGPFPPDPGLPPESDGACGPGRYAHFTVNGEPFFAWVGLGAEVSDEDRTTVQRAYEMMSAIDDWEPVPPDHVTPAYVIAGGALDDGGSWRLDLRSGERSPELFLDGVDPSLLGIELGHGQDTVVPAIPIEFCCGSTDGTADTVLLDVTFGFVRTDATGVELQVRDGGELTGQILPGTVVPVPPTLGSFGFDLFFIPGTAGLAGQVVPLGIDGSAEPPPVAEPRSEEVRVSGNLLGHEWSVRFTGNIADESSCIRPAIGKEQQPALCPGQPGKVFSTSVPSLHDWVTNDLVLKAGSVPSGVTDIRFSSDDGTPLPSQIRCQIGPLGWPDRGVCGIALPTEGEGTLEFVGADGTVLFEEGLAWASAEASSSNEYPWTNEGSFITARGSSLGAEWKLEVLYYLDGYRLTVDGRQVFEGVLMVGEPAAFTLSEGERATDDAIVLVVTGTHVDRVSIVSERIWEGRWVPGSTATGGKARLWVIEIPGAGVGSLRFDGVDQGDISWP